MWEKLIQLMIDKGLIAADKKDELATVLKDVKIEQPSAVGPIMVDTSKYPPELKSTIDTLVSTVNALKGQNKNLLDSLSTEKTARDAATAASEAQVKKEKDTKVAALVLDAFGDGKEKKGKLPEAKKDWFQTFAEKDQQAAEDFIKEYPGDPHMKPDEKGGGAGGGEKKVNPMSGVGGGNSAILKAVTEQSNVGESNESIFDKN